MRKLTRLLRRLSVYRRFVLLLSALSVVGPARLVLALPADDEEAKNKIESATESFLVADFKKAEKSLRAVLATCADRCSPPVMARAWMRIGLVQSVGYEDQAAARSSFDKALELDPSVTLDSELATPDATKAFEEAQAKRPGSDATPASSSEAERCQPGSPGCVTPGMGLKGDTCAASDECDTGLYCKENVCVPAPRCTRGTDCPLGECLKGYCVMPETGEPFDEQKAPKKAPPRARLYWVGLHFAPDIAIVSGWRICAREGWNSGFRCYNDDGDTIRTNAGNQQPDFSSDLSTTPILAGPRVLASFERVMAEQVTAGVRAGFSFGGSPKFLPLHGELFGSYWLAPLGKPGLRPYVGAGAGLAQVDAPVSVTNQTRDIGDASEDVNYDAFKKMGQIFLRLGGGAVYDLTDGIGVQGHLNLMYFLPATGFVVEPSIGGVFGF
ncbi:MAG: hypothetical protein JW940_20340 [Polyangiaceae bacterium]|nr:hypothetical protein [Polyangiaceae bacterium]